MSEPCGSCGDPSIHKIILHGQRVPACLRHLNHWRTPTIEHGYGDTSDCLCGRNFKTVRGLREHLTKQRALTLPLNTLPVDRTDHPAEGEA